MKKPEFNKTYDKNSVYASFSREEREAFQAWLKERDRDLGAMIEWHREVTKVHDGSIKA